MDIDKMLEERGEIHGDARTTHGIAMGLFNQIPETISKENQMEEASMAMLFLVFVKIARAVQRPDFRDHWDDIQGYIELIKRCEAPSDQK